MLIPEWHSEDAVELLMMTACAESDCGRYLQQIKGIALGIFQVEINTMNDIYKNWINFRGDTEDNIPDDIADKIFAVTGIYKPNNLALEGNIIYGAILARITYLRAPGKLPKKHDVNGMADYYVKWFNRGGKAKADVAMAKYRHYGFT